jgi:glyoxalase family protein
MTITGLHHVTAIAGEPQANINFYTAVLGLRLVKRTVNYDDPATYHFYFGDATGSPGSLITFFPWRGIPRGRTGTGQVNAVAFSIGEESIDDWMQQLQTSRVAYEGPVNRFGEVVLSMHDPAGLLIELVATNDEQPNNEDVAVREDSIQGVHHVEAAEEGYESTARLLTDVLGFKLIKESGNRFRFSANGAGFIDLLCMPSAAPGVMGSGTVHHIALRTPDDEQQKAWRNRLVSLGYNVSPIIDRQYFHSIYFREPGGVLFEIATDGPGFAVDEAPEKLGETLTLPRWLEPLRHQIERDLPPISLPVRK